jgi:hypothetical protein
MDQNVTTISKIPTMWSINFLDGNHKLIHEQYGRPLLGKIPGVSSVFIIIHMKKLHLRTGDPASKTFTCLLYHYTNRTTNHLLQPTTVPRVECLIQQQVHTGSDVQCIHPGQEKKAVAVLAGG